MRRTTVVGLLVALCLGLAAPAFAQARDPFDPLITPGTTTDLGSGTTTTNTGTVSPAPAPTSDALPNTGMNVSPWLALAYALLAMGAMIVAWSRVRAPLRG